MTPMVPMISNSILDQVQAFLARSDVVSAMARFQAVLSNVQLSDIDFSWNTHFNSLHVENPAPLDITYTLVADKETFRTGNLEVPFRDLHEVLINAFCDHQTALEQKRIQLFNAINLAINQRFLTQRVEAQSRLTAQFDKKILEPSFQQKRLEVLRERFTVQFNHVLSSSVELGPQFIQQTLDAFWVQSVMHE
jgi:hypothetical protein